MNIIKHMEAAFVVALAFAGSASLLIDTLPEAQAKDIATAGHMAVVTVSARRMSPIEKVRSLEEERQLAAALSASAPRKSS